MLGAHAPSHRAVAWVDMLSRSIHGIQARECQGAPFVFLIQRLPLAPCVGLPDLLLVLLREVPARGPGSAPDLAPRGLCIRLRLKPTPLLAHGACLQRPSLHII